MDALISLPTSVLFAAVVVYLLAGLVKGTIGIGLPTAAISLMAQFTDPRTAIALVIMPMLLTNAWQVWRTREHTHRIKQFLPLAASMSISIGVVSLVAPAVSIVLVTLLLGISVVLFAVVSLADAIPELKPRFNRQAQLAAGVSSGIIGGITGVWAPPIVIFMSAIRTDKTTFVAVAGGLLFMGSLVLGISYAAVGLITPTQALLSLLLVLPALAGFAIGEKIRDRLNEAAFRKVVLWFFLLMGLNLIRKAL